MLRTGDAAEKLNKEVVSTMDKNLSAAYIKAFNEMKLLW
jgi:hypothetical protein